MSVESLVSLVKDDESEVEPLPVTDGIYDPSGEFDES